VVSGIRLLPGSGWADAIIVGGQTCVVYFIEHKTDREWPLQICDVSNSCKSILPWKTQVSRVGAHEGRNPFYEPHIGKIDIGTLRLDSLAGSGEIIFRCARLWLFHHRKSVAFLHARW
jgi:hypothetical protein